MCERYGAYLCAYNLLPEVFSFFIIIIVIFFYILRFCVCTFVVNTKRGQQLERQTWALTSKEERDAWIEVCITRLIAVIQYVYNCYATFTSSHTTRLKNFQFFLSRLLLHLCREHEEGQQLQTGAPWIRKRSMIHGLMCVLPSRCC